MRVRTGRILRSRVKETSAWPITGRPGLLRQGRKAAVRPNRIRSATDGDFPGKKLEEATVAKKRYRALFLAVFLLRVGVLGIVYHATVLDYAMLENVTLAREGGSHQIVFQFDVVKPGRVDLHHGQAVLTDRKTVRRGDGFRWGWRAEGPTEIAVRSRRGVLPRWDRETFTFRAVARAARRRARNHDGRDNTRLADRQRRPDRRRPGGAGRRAGLGADRGRLVPPRPAGRGRADSGSLPVAGNAGTERPDPHPAQCRRRGWNADSQLGQLDGGTALTVDDARQGGKPYWVVALEMGIEPAAFRAWLAAHHITVLNVAGPRESKRPGVYAAAYRLLEALLRPAGA